MKVLNLMFNFSKFWKPYSFDHKIWSFHKLCWMLDLIFFVIALLQGNSPVQEEVSSLTQSPSLNKLTFPKPRLHFRNFHVCNNLGSR